MCVYDAQCDGQNAECHTYIHISAPLQSLFKFQSSAVRYRL